MKPLLFSRRNPFTPQFVEVLENRIAPAAFVVDTIADTIAVDGLVSLREAITAANTNAASGDAAAGEAVGDMILFAASLNGQSIMLVNGQLSITEGLSIIGETVGGVPVDVTVNGNNLFRIFQIDTTQTVTFDDFSLTNGNAGSGNSGGAINMAVAGKLNLLSMEIENNKAGVNGGGIFNNGGALIISSSDINDNIAFGGNANQGGGGIYSQGGSVLISDSTLDLNDAPLASGNGGAIFNNGGAFTLIDCGIEDNTAARAGGGIESTGGTMAIVDCLLSGNFAGINGGGLHISGAGRVTISGGAVTLNTAEQEGGGLWNSSTGTLMLRTYQGNGTTILNNIAKGNNIEQGGGGIFNDGGLVTVKAATIQNNSSTATADGNGGGGIFNDGKMILDDVTITANIATAGLGSGGGILNSNGGVLTVLNGTITNNNAARAGGGIENNGGVVRVSDSSISNNTAGINGGAVHTSGAGTVTIQFSIISSNTAGQEGGGLWNSFNGTLDVADSTITGNIANGDGTEQGGGGIFNDGGLTIISGSQITNNIANALAVGNGGGGIFNDGEMTIFDSTIEANSVGNGSASGGGILNSNGGDLAVFSSSIRNNSAARAGGGLEANGGLVLLSDIDLSGNEAGINGGAVHISGVGSVTIEFADIFENEAGNEGGALWNSSQGTLIVTDAVIDSNLASFGGGIHNDGGTLTITRSTISYNEATNTGGGLNAESGNGIISIVNSTIAANTTFAFEGGGIAITGPATLNISNSTIAFNSANNSGGGIFNFGATVNLVSTLVAGNEDVNGLNDLVNANGTYNADHSLVQSAVAGTINGTSTANLLNVDPLIDIETFNFGGIVEIPEDSPAINAGSNPLNLTTDQFGNIRVYGIAADIGAFEQTDLPANPIFAVTSGKTDRVIVVDALTSGILFQFDAFAGNKAIVKGVTVATGDVNGDGVADIIVGATASRLGPVVKVFDGVSHTEVSSFLAFEPTFKGGVYVAAGDLNNDGVDEIVVGSAAGRISGPNVKAFTDAGVELGGFSPYGFSSTSGARVAVGDVNGDGFADIITGPDKGAFGAHVKVFSGATGLEVDSFLAYDTPFTKGVHVAAGDVDGDGIAEIITGHDAGRVSTVKVFSRQGFGTPQLLLDTFIGFAPTFRGGVRVAAADVDGDGDDDIILGTGPGKLPEVQLLDGRNGTQIDALPFTDKEFLSGIFVG
jgi:hypothetical protein